MIFWIFFLILSLIVEVYLWWKLQASLLFLSGRTCTIGGWLNTFLPHCTFPSPTVLYKIMRPCSVGPAVSIQAQWFYESLMWNPPFISIFAHSRSSCATYRVNAALSSKSAWPFAVSRGLKCDIRQTGAQHTHYTLMWPSVCVTPTHIHWP